MAPVSFPLSVDESSLSFYVFLFGTLPLIEVEVYTFVL